MRLGSSIKRRRSTTGDGGSVWDRVPPWLTWTAGVALGGFGIGWLFATRLLFPTPPPPGDLYEVPDVRGESFEDARIAINEAGLVLGDVSSLRHPEVDSGRVLGQAPLPGQLASPESAVRVTLSLGPERRSVPDLSRIRADRARNVLVAAGFGVVVDSVEAPDPAGTILGIEPEPGTEVALPTEVTLRVSLGPPLVPMPLILGMDEAEARDTLAALGLAVDSVREVFRFGRDQGIVVEQSPPADSLVERGSTVRFAVGRRGSRGRSGRGRGSGGARGN